MIEGYGRIAKRRWFRLAWRRGARFISTWPGLESLESRLFLAATVIDSIGDIQALVTDSSTTIDLANHFDDPDSTGTVVRFDTSLGLIDVDLFDNITPLTVQNFLNYADPPGGEARYDHTIIHRSMPEFVQQGGGFVPTADPTNDQNHITVDSPVVNEFQNLVDFFGPDVPINVRGTIAMAKQGGNPDSATSEWFFSAADNSDNLDNQNGGFTVFGRVLREGMIIVDAMEAVPIYNAGGGFSALPLRDVESLPLSDDNYVLINSIRQIDELQLQVINNTGSEVVATSIDESGRLVLDYSGTPGTAEVTVQASDLGGQSISHTFNVTAAMPNMEIDVTGNGQSIAIGDDTPDLGDHTDFGILAIDGQTVTRTFTIHNLGNNDLQLTSDPLIGITGSDAADFTVIQDPSATIGSNSTTQFQVQFNPSQLGSRSARIEFINNDSDESLYSFSIQGEVGTIIEFGGKTKAVFEDKNGDTVTIALKGPGAGQIILGVDADLDSDDARLIQLDNTTLKSSLKIVAKGGDGLTTVQEIIVNGSLGKLVAKTTSLGGRVMITGTAKLIQLDDIDAVQDTITIGEPTSEKDTITLKFDKVFGIAVATQTPIKSLTATEWIAVDGVEKDEEHNHIDAPWIGKIAIKGNKKVGILGHFNVSLNLDPSGLDRQPKRTLGSVKVAGGIDGKVWNLVGDAGAIRASKASDWSLNLAGSLKGAKFGEVSNSYISASDHIGSVSVANWKDGSITGKTFKSFKASGNRKTSDPGNVNLDMTLLGDPDARSVLGNVKVAGSLSGRWIVRGVGGAVSAGEIDSSFHASFSGDVKGISTKGDAGGFLAAINFKKLNFKGDVSNLKVFGGTDLGRDGEFGGTGEDADDYQAGMVGSFKIGGAADDLQLHIGVDPFNGVFDDGDDIYDPLGELRSLSVRNELANGIIVANRLPKRIKVNGENVSPSKFTPDLSLADQCIQHTSVVQHFHPSLAIIIDGQPVLIPADVGIDSGASDAQSACMHVVHTHDTTGVLHVETKELSDVSLGLFFEFWDQEFSDTQILDHVINDSHELVMTVNGQASDAFEDLILVANQEIVIEYRERE